MKNILLVFLASFLVAVESQKVNRGTYTYEFRSGNRKINDHNTKSPVNQQYYNGIGKTDRPQQKTSGGIPPYAVSMEPVIHYSQPDPLFVQEKQNLSILSYESQNDLIKKAAFDDSRTSQSVVSPKAGTPSPYEDSVTSAANAKWISAKHVIHASYRRKPKPRPTYPPPTEPPEPIIEIIIKESNISLPGPPPPPPPPKKKKEPVQVFFVKYSKDPNAEYGEEKLIYEAPIPAVTPPTNNEDPHEDIVEEAPYPESVTYGPPPPSTTIKAIIKPDSEIYHGTGGLQITFGGPHDENDFSHHHGGGGYPSDNSGYPSSHHHDYHEHAASEPAATAAYPRKSVGISRASSDAQPAKRHPESQNVRPTQSTFASAQEYKRPVPLATYQQTPQFPAQNFQKSFPGHHQHHHHHHHHQQQQQPTVNIPRQPQPTQTYSTLPQNLFQNAAGHHHFGSIQTAQSTQQYHTINDHHLRQNFQSNVRPTPPQQYHTITQQTNHYRTIPNNFPSQPTSATSFIQKNQQPYRPFDGRKQVNLFEQIQQQRNHFQNLQQQPPFHQYQLQQPENRPQPQTTKIPHTDNTETEIIKSISPDISTLTNPQSSKQSFPAPRPPFNHQVPPPSRSAFQSFHTAKSTVQYSTSRPQYQPTNSRPIPTYRTTTTTTTTTQKIYTTQQPIEYVTEDPKKLEEERRKKEERRKQNVAALPKEVPDDLRQQLLSSGILSNADIQILDYDKIGDIPIESLPPEALANFQQVAVGSEPIPSIVQPEKDVDSEPSGSENHETVLEKQATLMEMKVVRFNPDSKEGAHVADSYVREGATQLDPVVLNDSKYNRYLPLKVAGAQFPVPDVPELRGRNVTSVVVLAPVDYEFLQRKESDGSEAVSRSAGPVLEVQGVHFIAGDTLKNLVKFPTAENYRKWLQKENSTVADKQSVVLLVLEPNNQSEETKDIYMFDITTQRVSKLKGELSATFVEVAESNSQNEDLEEISDNPSAPGGDFTITDTSGLPNRFQRSSGKGK